MREPWFRKSDGWWYITILDDAGNRRHERLSQDRDAAFDEWHKRASQPAAGSSDMLVAQVLDLFLNWSVKHQPESTFAWHKLYLHSFARRWGKLSACELKPHHVTNWMERAQFKTGVKSLSSGAARGAIASIKRALNWAVHEGYLKANPLATVKRPRSGRREQMVDTDSGDKLARDTDGAFRTFLIALKLTGCRPKELRTVEAKNVNLEHEVWERVHNKTAKATGLNRTIYISNPCINALTRILVHFRPKGPLFLNSQGRPWSDNAIRCRMRRARVKHSLPAGTVAYSYRHTYITEALANGVDAATVAELCGTSVEMIHRHYGHLTQKGDLLRNAARLIGNRQGTSALEEKPNDGGEPASAPDPQNAAAESKTPSNRKRRRG